MPLTGAEYRRVASRGALLAFVRARRERLAAQPAVPEDVKFRKTQETRQRKPSKRLKRQEPERKEKHRERFQPAQVHRCVPYTFADVQYSSPRASAPIPTVRL